MFRSIPETRPYYPPLGLGSLHPRRMTPSYLEKVGLLALTPKLRDLDMFMFGLMPVASGVRNLNLKPRPYNEHLKKPVGN